MVIQMDGQTRNQIERRRHKHIYRQIQARRDLRTDKQTKVHKDKWLNQLTNKLIGRQIQEFRDRRTNRQMRDR
jgi:hypothetical protein